MRIAIVLPRNMHFGPRAASSIDLCVRDAGLYSRFRDRSVIICQEADLLFDGFEIETYQGGSTRNRLSQIEAIVRRLSADLIIVHQHLPSASALAKRFSNTPVLLHKHNFIHPTSWFRRQRRYRQFRRLGGIIFVSEACRQTFKAGFPNSRIPLHVAHNGLNAIDWPPNPAKKKEIVAVGRIEGRKGMTEIAVALGTILSEFPDWSAKIVGAMSDEPEFGDGFADLVSRTGRLDWTGPLPFSEVIAATRQAQIAVVNSRQEAFGRVAIEAFAAETALVSTAVGGLAEVIGDTAVRLESGEPGEIVSALRALLQDDMRRKQLGKQGRAIFEAQFTIERTAATLDQIYQETLT